jgi:uncharacterized protein (TIGR02145 family)
LGEPKNVQNATLQLSASLYGTTDANGNLRIDIPSGLDARGTISPFNLTVNSDPLASLATPANDDDSGVAFSLAQTWPATLTTSPTVYSSLQATDMSSGTGAVTAADPWTTRQTVLDFSGQAGCPPAPAGRTVTLNQTNYAILAYNNVNPNLIGTASNFITLNTKYKMATILLEDTTTLKRAKDYTVTVVQCQGTEDMSSVNKTATPEQTSAGAASWNEGTTPAEKVVHHQAKSGVYEEFYSAWFGAAGRWMTTNLAAHAYDENSHSQDIALTLSASNSHLNPYWCYPNGGSGGSNATSYNNNPHVGLLYNWSAATAGKGGDTGEQNIYNPSGSNYAGDEGNYQEGTTSGQQQRIQGICPKGWHLPSDREWNQLEKEIYTNPQLYSYYTDETGWNTASWQSSWEASVNQYRPSSSVAEAHGKAMKEVCGVPSSYTPNGRSKNLATGGFNVLLAGRGDLSAFAFGTEAHFWSSSSYYSVAAWGRSLYDSNASVGRGNNNDRRVLYSVRCKKDPF